MSPPNNEQIMFEMLKDSINKVSEQVTEMDRRMRAEIAINNVRHERLSNNHTAMKGDIRMVSAKVAGMVSVAVAGLSLMLKKMGLY